MALRPALRVVVTPTGEMETRPKTEESPPDTSDISQQAYNKRHIAQRLDVATGESNLDIESKSISRTYTCPNVVQLYGGRNITEPDFAHESFLTEHSTSSPVYMKLMRLPPGQQVQRESEIETDLESNAQESSKSSTSTNMLHVPDSEISGDSLAEHRNSSPVYMKLLREQILELDYVTIKKSEQNRKAENEISRPAVRQPPPRFPPRKKKEREKQKTDVTEQSSGDGGLQWVSLSS